MEVFGSGLVAGVESGNFGGRFSAENAVFGRCAFVPFFAISRTFKQKCGILWLLRCAGVRAVPGRFLGRFFEEDGIHRFH